MESVRDYRAWQIGRMKRSFDVDDASWQLITAVPVGSLGVQDTVCAWMDIARR